MRSQCVGIATAVLRAIAPRPSIECSRSSQAPQRVASGLLSGMQEAQLMQIALIDTQEAQEQVSTPPQLQTPSQGLDRATTPSRGLC